MGMAIADGRREKKNPKQSLPCISHKKYIIENLDELCNALFIQLSCFTCISSKSLHGVNDCKKKNIIKARTCLKNDIRYKW